MNQSKPTVNPPLWLLAELTYRCPLQCPYCSNPLDFARQDKELTTEQWIEVFRQARAMGSVQLGFSGGEPDHLRHRADGEQTGRLQRGRAGPYPD